MYFYDSPVSLVFLLWEGKQRSCGFTLGTIKAGMGASGSLARLAHFHLSVLLLICIPPHPFPSQYLFFIKSLCNRIPKVSLETERSCRLSWFLI